MALTVERLGLTAIFGAVLVGLAIPAGKDGPWTATAASVAKAGRALVPVFFVVTGITVLTSAFAAASWALIVIATTLGALGKLGGGYLGARRGGQSRRTSARVGVLMNTRGLTELIVLKVGYSAGILSAPLFLALVVMALTTTAMTGPLLLLIDRMELRRRPVPAPVETGSGAR